MSLVNACLSVMLGVTHRVCKAQTQTKDSILFQLWPLVSRGGSRCIYDEEEIGRRHYRAGFDVGPETRASA